MTKDQLAAELRKQGYGRIADMLDGEIDLAKWGMLPDADAKAEPATKKKAK